MGHETSPSSKHQGYYYPGFVERGDERTINLEPIGFMEIFNDVAVELPMQPNLMEVKTEINKVVHRIEDEVGLWRALITVTIGTTDDTIDGTTDDIEDITTDVDKLGRFSSEFFWDASEKRLRLPDTVVEVKEVYIDNEEWKQVTYAEVKDSNNSSEEIFHQVGKFIYFPIELAAETTILKIRVKSMYGGVTEYDGYGIGDQTVNMPPFYRQMLVSGVLMNLTVRQKYKDVDLYQHNKEIFERETVQLKQNYDNLVITYLTREPYYQY